MVERWYDNHQAILGIFLSNLWHIFMASSQVNTIFVKLVLLLFFAVIRNPADDDIILQ